MSSVRVGIIGYGGMGSFHANYLFKGEVPDATLTAVCDVAPERLEAAKKAFGDQVKTFETADALFAAGVVDAVLIATPHYFHPPLAIQAFQHGCHVLSEKPAGVYTKQVREMNEAAERSGKVFGLMFNQRTLAGHQKMRELVQSGELGEIRRTHYVITDWFRTQAYYNSGGWRATWSGEGGGVLANQCPHNLDLWQWICGMPSRVRAFCSFGKYHDIEVEDDVTAYVEYPNGATGVFITSTGEAPGSNSFEITGDRGRLVLEGGKLTFWRTRSSVQKYIYEAQGGFQKPETWQIEIPAGGGEGHKGITKNWIQAITSGAPLLARGEEGINGVQLANAMLLSTWTDDWVEIPVDEELFLARLKEKIETSTVQKSSGSALNFDGTFGSGA
ncbi:MAG TPA: Gfo/Idh/MocA family oxidoreductase [Armatimonadota bacterium]|nr:Gfo/Idh/MocA family oxidoreductase [Armatimonadota bacterium]HOJ20721.1 Gfo/Idh/MocA family oxidoreductase [Armatimonadota bacterium]HOM82758.1 Gfo/Idh/MocA family oxidoreductase [Armatimonadota bacterium]HPO74621.1 Gfo/Idh/MocA family oxidoreductase [Armatimonadota bacterium]HPT99945.1 Gfo/Idh/MocA family oxidoreductase [Armatimonadota bacterium]